MQQDQSSMKSKLVLWLLTGCFFVFGMVVVGGITRLTGSGLSITEWKVVTGVIPPLNEAQWNESFDHYKQIPQFKLINSNFTLQDYKYIFFWEFIHRFFGRMIGVVFLIGFAYFYYKKAIDKKLMPQLLFMFVLGGIQGFLGWYMVSSGLTENIRVSHIRLAIHLTFAFITFGYVFWVALKQLYYDRITNVEGLTKYRTLAKTLLGLVVLQVIYGAFVAGTKAGWAYNTWPKMGDDWIASSIGFAWAQNGISSLVNNIATVQFIHRDIAYLILLVVAFLWWKKDKETFFNASQKQAIYFLGMLVSIQVALGIFTLLAGVPIWMGVTHQAVAFFVFAGSIYFLHRLSYE